MHKYDFDPEHEETKETSFEDRTEEIAMKLKLVGQLQQEKDSALRSVQSVGFVITGGSFVSPEAAALQRRVDCSLKSLKRGIVHLDWAEPAALWQLDDLAEQLRQERDNAFESLRQLGGLRAITVFRAHSLPPLEHVPPSPS